jgi:RNA polymerase sigma-70 factor, ECF subfamily
MIHADSPARLRGAALPTDGELATRVAAGDVAAFTAIMRRHNRLLFRTARSILKSDAEAEDALQDAYLRAWRRIDGFRGEAKLSTWLSRIVINEALARLRSNRAAPGFVFDAAAESGGDHAAVQRPDEHADRQPEGMAMRAEVRRLIEDGIDRLPDAFRTVFMLRAIEEMSVQEVAEVLDLPEATVRTRLFRARGLLRECLARDVDPERGDAFAFAGKRCDRIVARMLGVIGALPPVPASSFGLWRMRRWLRWPGALLDVAQRTRDRFLPSYK